MSVSLKRTEEVVSAIAARRNPQYAKDVLDAVKIFAGLAAISGQLERANNNDGAKVCVIMRDMFVGILSRSSMDADDFSIVMKAFTGDAVEATNSGEA